VLWAYGVVDVSIDGDILDCLIIMKTVVSNEVLRVRWIQGNIVVS
jgi:hypothetical protein